MGAMTLPRGREFTRADLDAMPDDGNRYELIDGALVETARVSGDQRWRSEVPFPVELMPSALRDLRLE